MKKRIAIANRGEVALRIHRAIKKMGHYSLLLHSEPDRDSEAYRQCDETYCIGGGPAAESYINIEAVLKGALELKADLIHPGFGFLSENADFAQACEEKDLHFIGPSPMAMKLFGDKISAKNLCEKIGVPTLKSYRGADQSLETLKREAEEISYPVLIKASAGGGGRGMRIVREEKDFAEALESAKSEALKAFGSDQVFVEKYLEESKHIEVQVFGDTSNHIHILGERECSVQRRHQKIIEEALSPSLSDTQREKVYSYARLLAEKAHYHNAGTVEFLFDGKEFYFLEVNTRLQVEHPVTEEVFGLDLVEAQIKTALKQEVSLPKIPHGHSIECRIYAEDLKGFPSVGKLGSLNFGEAKEGVRLEQGFKTGDRISPFYDSMICKFIYTAESRKAAIEKALLHLKSCKVTGVYTNIPLLIKILEHKDFIEGSMTTKFFERNFGSGLEAPFSEEELQKLFLKERNKNKNSLFSENWRKGL